MRADTVFVIFFYKKINNYSIGMFQVKTELLAPGMQHSGDAAFATQPLRIFR